MKSLDLFLKYQQTISFYFFVIACASYFAFLSYRKQNRRLNIMWFSLSFIVLFIFMGGNSYSVDYDAYHRMFDESSSLAYIFSSRIEKGYLLFNSIIRYFTDSFAVFHAIWAFVILFLYYSTIAKYKDVLHPGRCILAYSCIYMIQSLALMRMHLAIAIIFWGIRYIIQKRYVMFLGVIVVAALFHKSAICMLFPLFIIFATQKKGHYFSKVVVCLFCYSFMYIFRESIFKGGVWGFPYGIKEKIVFGIAPIIYVFPICLLLLYTLKRNHHSSYDRVLVTDLFVFTIAGFTLSMMRYYLSMISRAVFYFTFSTIVFPAYLMKINSDLNCTDSKGLNIVRYNNGVMMINRNALIINIMYIIYFIFRAFMMIESIESDGLQVYKSVFGFEI